MNHTVVRLEQNTPAWELWRQTRFGASDAAAMLGISPYKTRAQLLREKQGAITPVSDFQREIYAAGHAAEKAILPHLEDLAGQPITPCVMEGENRITASLDGVNFEGTLIIEHKLLRDSDASRRRFNMAARGELAEHDMAQVQQQIMVSGAEKCWFVVSDGTPENMAIADVFPDVGWFARIRAGWAQFARDLDAATDEVPQILAQEYRDLDAQIKALQSQQQAVKDQLIALAEEADSDSLAVGGITLKRIESKGAVDYKAIPALKDIDLDAYRKPASITWRININKE
jgi:putative phage-type endonuclease|uniref:Exonuclease n=1 Tax=Siphoviridae sp. ctMBu2 TaxID=2827853 RepID=A0A8S5T612_9CAUD|nr:MAG TPA: Exonuclease [Siphoviridae sp. ctMBu2]